MPAAILFRGHAHRTIGQGRPWGVDWKLCVESHRTHLIEPLRARYGDLDTYLISYETPLWDEVKADYKTSPASFGQLTMPGESQRGTFLRGLDLIASVQREWGNYDLIATCRFDLELLKCPLDHGTFRPDCVNFLWREWNAESWNHHHRVPDAIHLLPGDLLDGFRKGVAEQPSETCLHLVHDPVQKHCNGRVHVMQPEGYTDSNTDVMPNPVYKMIRVQS